MDQHYPSDFSDGQWQLFVHCCQRRPSGPSADRRREIIDAILYVVRTGCQWRQLPLDFPKWKTVYTVFRRWRESEGAVGAEFTTPCGGDFAAASASAARPRRRSSTASRSQGRRGEERGYDAGKKITGRKRHLAVDTLGLVWTVVVHGA